MELPEITASGDMLAWWPQCVYGQSPLCNAVTALQSLQFRPSRQFPSELKHSKHPRGKLNAAKARGIVFSQNPTIAIFSATGFRRNGKRSRLTQELILPLPYTSRSFKELIVAFPHPGPLNSTSTEVPMGERPDGGAHERLGEHGVDWWLWRTA